MEKKVAVVIEFVTKEERSGTRIYLDTTESIAESRFNAEYKTGRIESLTKLEYQDSILIGGDIYHITGN